MLSQAQSEMVKELLTMGISPAFLYQELVAFQAGKIQASLETLHLQKILADHDTQESHK